MWHKFLLKSGGVFFKFRNFLFPLFAIAVVLFTKPAYFLGNPSLDNFVVALGTTLTLAGGGFRLLVIGFAYIKRGGKDGRVYADNLVCEGFYAHVRNPMYIGNFLILVGMGIIYGSAWVYWLVIPFFTFAYYAIIVTEENYLRGHFGAEYDKYCEKVNRFFPDFRGIRKSLKEFSYDWRKAIRKDYGTFFGLLLGCVATWLYKRYHFHSFPRNKNEATVAAAIVALIGICWGVTRILKKRGFLKSPAA